MKNKLIIPLLLLTSIAILNCNDSSAKVKLSRNNLTLSINDTIKLKVKNCCSNVKWKSNRKKIASVNKNGKITAKSIGKCNIICTFKNKKLKCHVTVISNKNSDNKTQATATPVLAVPDSIQADKIQQAAVQPQATTSTVIIPTATPESKNTTRTLDNCYVRYIKNGYIGLSDGTTADMPTFLILSRLVSDKTLITYNGQSITANDIRPGDVLKIQYSGIQQLSYPVYLFNCISIEVLSHNPDFCNKTYTYSISSVNDGIIHLDSLSVSINLNNSSIKKIMKNGSQIELSDLKDGDIIRIIDGEGYDCDSKFFDFVGEIIEVVS